jgi:hypothetical protein
MLILILFSASLIGCSPAKQIVKTEYIKQEVPTLPALPTFYPVAWQAGDGRYCLDESQAKEFLKNIEIMKSYQNEMRGILQGLKDGK